jgi:hypothetical protein
MEWFYKPKVQLGLWVNFIFVIFTMASPPTPVRSAVNRLPYAGDRSRSYEPPSVPYAPLPPASAPGKATVVNSGGRVSVFLNNDLTLVKKTGRTLVFSPSFSSGTSANDPPLTVMFRFIIFSDKEQACPGNCILNINADGYTVWTTVGEGPSGWTREKIPATKTTLPDGQVAETLAAETLSTKITYDKFVDIISADRVVLRLGPDTVELTHDQIEALRDMHRQFVPSPSGQQEQPKFIKTF